jgi:hypothetical protein
VRSDWEDDEAAPADEALPPDIDDATRYVPLPDRRDLDLGSRLVFRFAADVSPAFYARVRDAFSRRGGYRRFRVLLERNDLPQRWYDYRDGAQRAALREWCEAEGLPLEE